MSYDRRLDPNERVVWFHRTLTNDMTYCMDMETVEQIYEYLEKSFVHPQDYSLIVEFMRQLHKLMENRIQ
jgi:hypothetical protein